MKSPAARLRKLAYGNEYQLVNPLPVPEPGPREQAYATKMNAVSKLLDHLSMLADCMESMDDSDPDADSREQALDDTYRALLKAKRCFDHVNIA